jgi:hypothetical protein
MKTIILILFLLCIPIAFAVGTINTDKEVNIAVMANTPNTQNPLSVNPRQLLRCNSELVLFWGNSSDNDLYMVKSVNNGSTWVNSTRIRGTTGLYSTDCYDDNYYIGKIQADGNIYMNYSLNGGKTWVKTLIKSSAVTFSANKVEVQAVNETDVWLMLSNTSSSISIFKSTNSGVSWIQTGKKTTNTFTTTYKVTTPVNFYAYKDTILAVGTNASSTLIGYKSTDKGATWSSKFLIAQGYQARQGDAIYGVGYENNYYLAWGDYAFWGSNQNDICLAYTTDLTNWNIDCGNFSDHNSSFSGCLDGRPSLDTQNFNLFYGCDFDIYTGSDKYQGRYNKWNITSGWGGGYNYTTLASNRYWLPHQTKYTYQGRFDFAAGDSAKNLTFISVKVGTTSLIPNNPPTFNQALVTKSLYHTTDLKYLINCSDEDDDVITYTDNTTLFAINSATGEINHNPSFSESAANYSILITCSDGEDSVSDKFLYRILDRSPTFNQALVNKSVYHNQNLKYLINCTDPEGDTITYYDNTGLFNINSATGQIDDNPTLAQSMTNQTIRINCSDTKKFTSSSFVYEILDRPPKVTTAMVQKNIFTGQPISYDIDATDPEGDTVTYTDNTSLFVINSASGLIEDTPTSGDVGLWSILITVSDTKLTNTSTFLYNITEAPVNYWINPVRFYGGFKMYGGKLRLYK